MIIIQQGTDEPVMQGSTTLAPNQTISYHGKESLTVHCNCGKPFAESLMEMGIIINTVVCSACGKEIAHIVEKTVDVKNQ